MVLAIFPEIVLSAIRVTKPASNVALTGLFLTKISSRFKQADNSPITQFAESFTSPDSLATVSKYSAISRCELSSKASFSDKPSSSIKRCFLASGNSGKSARTLAFSSSETTTGNKSGQGK